MPNSKKVLALLIATIFASTAIYVGKLAPNTQSSLEPFPEITPVTSDEPTEDDTPASRDDPSNPDLSAQVPLDKSDYPTGGHWDVEPTPVAILIQQGISPEDAPTVLLDRSSDTAVRTQAAFAIAQMQREEFLGALHEAVKEPDSAVREAAVSSLNYLHSQESTSVLRALLKNEVVHSVREAATIALGSIATPEAADVLLIPALNEFDGLDSRLTAISGLGRVGSPEQLRELTVLVNDANPSVRLQTSIVLARNLDSAFLKDVVRNYDDDADIFTLVQAAELIGEVSGEDIDNPAAVGVATTRWQIERWWSNHQSR